MTSKRSTRTGAVFLAAALSACTGGETSPPASGPTSTIAAPSLDTQAWTLPATGAGFGQPDLVRAPDGSLLLSWVEHRARGHALHFARFRDGRWSAPRQIAQGEDWFVNWADTPHIAATADGALWVHWLRTSGQARHAFDVVLARSADDGATWSPPVAVNTDGKPVEHGFVALWAQDAASLGVAWLDGRDTGTQQDHDAHGHHDDAAGAMSLRSALFDGTLQRHGETRIDAATCDCCQTDVALTDRGALLVYRDREPGEIRDIAAVGLQADGWTSPRPVYADHWHMPACPVNGPAVAARGNDAIVAWYTSPDEMPALKLARSSDAGERFGTPVIVDQGQAVQGRTDVALDADAAWVLWLREEAGGQTLQLARYAPDLSRELQRMQVARLQGRGRGTGLPKIALVDGRAHVVWTDVIDGKPQLRGAVIAAR